jgi:benzoate membrane transport protein
MEPPAGQRRTSQPVLAGILAAVVGITSSSAVIVAGLRGVGASPAQAASALFALCLLSGVITIWMSLRHRLPIMAAWSTPGAALLAGTGVVHGGWPAAVGGFLIVAVLIIVTGWWPRLGRVIAAIPAPIAQAMLAGIVLELCLTPVRGLASHPWAVGPILLTWLVLLRLAPKWAVPAAFVITLAVVGVDVWRHGGAGGSLLPHLDVTTPAFTWAGLLSIAIPLYIVTMAGQNIPGVAVMASYGYQVPWRESMAVTGIATAVAAPFGGHAMNLAAISASLCASPDADPDPGRRWIASSVCGIGYLVLGLVSAAFTTLASAVPADVIGAVAGLALLGTLASSLAGALSASRDREAAAITFVVAASGLTFGGIGAAFWALIAGLLVRAVLTARARGPVEDAAPDSAGQAVDRVSG